MAWVTDHNRKTRVLWMDGAVGAGKTAIAQKIAERCYSEGILAASFFCSRSIPGRNEKTYLITTIVSQLILVIPRMRKHVGKALYADHLLLSRSLEAQLEVLIVKPLKMSKSKANAIPKLIILDGLDECGHSESHQSVLRVILAAVNRHNLPFSFLIASRPEQKIRETFNEIALRDITVRLVLDGKYHPDIDIRAFLVSKFEDIKERHPSGTTLGSWPSEEVVERLVQMSSGQFIYPSIVIKFIDSYCHWPPERLDIIFGMSPPGKTTPFAEMDALYSHILSAASDNIEKALEIFTVMLYLRKSHHSRGPTVQFLESFLSYRTGEVFMVLSDLHSIISMPSPSDTPGNSLQFFHTSLGDFLTDYSRCGRVFFLDPGISHSKMAIWIMKEIQESSSRIHDYLLFILSDLHIAGTEIYLGHEFVHHCRKSIPTPEFFLKLGNWDVSRFPCNTGSKTSSIQVLDAVHSDDWIPKFLVWLNQQVSPESNFGFSAYSLL